MVNLCGVGLVCDRRIFIWSNSLRLARLN